MLLAGVTNIRDVIAFPKTTSASALMEEAPNVVSEEQLNELGIKILDDEKRDIINLQSLKASFGYGSTMRKQINSS